MPSSLFSFHSLTLVYVALWDYICVKLTRFPNSPIRLEKPLSNSYVVCQRGSKSKAGKAVQERMRKCRKMGHEAKNINTASNGGRVGALSALMCFHRLGCCCFIFCIIMQNRAVFFTGLVAYMLHSIMLQSGVHKSWEWRVADSIRLTLESSHVW